MRSSKFRLTALLAMLIAGTMVLASCGGDDASSDTTVAEETTTTENAAQTPESGNSEGGEDRSQGQDGAGNGGGQGSGSASRGGAGNGGEATPVPDREHNDSGGGSEQFLTEGGDNSVQEFGQEAAQSEFDQVATALHDFLDARSVLNWEQACSHVSQTIIDSLEQMAQQAEGTPAECPALLKMLSGNLNRQIARQQAVADVGSVRIEGERAFAIFRGAEGVVYLMPMAREDDEWRVATVVPTPLQ